MARVYVPSYSSMKNSSKVTNPLPENNSYVEVDDDYNNTILAPKSHKTSQSITNDKVSQSQREVITNSPSRLIRCACGFSSLDAHNFKIHLVEHASSEGFPTAYVDNLKRHVGIQVMENQFSCSHCSASFTRKDKLTEHLKAHFEEAYFSETPFTCSRCSFSALWMSDIAKHETIHKDKDINIDNSKKYLKQFDINDKIHLPCFVPIRKLEMGQLHTQTLAPSKEKNHFNFYRQELTNEDAVNKSDDEGAVTNSDGEVAVDNSDGEVAVDNSDREVAVKNSDGEVAVDNSDGEVAVDNSDGEDAVSIYHGEDSSDEIDSVRYYPVDNPNAEATKYFDSELSRVDSEGPCLVTEPLVILDESSNCSIISLENLPSSEKQASFSCNQCNYITTTKSKIKIHQLIHYPSTSDSAVFDCSYCSYSTPVKAYFKGHLRTHTDEKAYKCALCSYSTKWKHHLRTHEVLHKGIRPDTTTRHNERSQSRFQCITCKFITSSRYSFEKHSLEHDPSKAFQCALCSYSTVWRPHMTSHMKSHKNDKAFSCRHCDYACVWRHQLKEHQKVHSNDKPFHCTRCSFTTKWKKYMKRHDLTHSEPGTFKCSLCSYSGNLERDLIEHTNNYHASENSVNLDDGEVEFLGECRSDESIAQSNSLEHTIVIIQTSSNEVIDLE